jgi:hypothetical protein
MSPTPSARLEGTGLVRLKGLLDNTTGGTVAAGTTLFTMPVGLRPPGGAIFAAPEAGANNFLFIAGNATATLNGNWASFANLGLDGKTWMIN